MAGAPAAAAPAAACPPPGPMAAGGWLQMGEDAVLKAPALTAARHLSAASASPPEGASAAGCSSSMDCIGRGCASTAGASSLLALGAPASWFCPSTGSGGAFEWSQQSLDDSPRAAAPSCGESAGKMTPCRLPSAPMISSQGLREERGATRFVESLSLRASIWYTRSLTQKTSLGSVRPTLPHTWGCGRRRRAWLPQSCQEQVRFWPSLEWRTLPPAMWLGPQAHVGCWQQRHIPPPLPPHVGCRGALHLSAAMEARCQRRRAPS